MTSNGRVWCAIDMKEYLADLFNVDIEKVAVNILVMSPWSFIAKVDGLMKWVKMVREKSD